MATSSIFKNFVICGNEQAQIFVDAVEKAEKAKEKRQSTGVSYEFVTDRKEARKALRKWKHLYGNKKGED